jgi:hypothetical protein
LPGAVGPEDRETLAVSQLEIERPQPEAVALDDRLLEASDDVAAAALRGQLQLELPGGPRLLDPLDAAAALLHRLGEILALLLLAPLPVAALLPAAHLARLLLDPLALGGVVDVCLLLALAGARALACELAPAAAVGPHAPRLRLEFDDPRHPLEEGAIVRDDHHAPAVGVDEAVEQLEPRHVEVVGRLIEQRHVGGGGDQRFEPDPRRLAGGAASLERLLGESGDGEVRGLAAHDARVRRLKPGEHAQQRRLADPVWADDTDTATGRDRQRELIEHDHVSIRLADVARGEHAARMRHG